MDPLSFVSDILNIGVGTFTLGTLISVVILLLVATFAIKFVMKIVERTLEKTHLEIGMQKFLRSVIKVLLYVLAGLIIADKIGIPVTSLVAALSVVGVAVSLAIQGSLSNLAGGVLLMVTKPFVVGDYVEAGGVSGTVTEVGIAYTKMTTPDNKMICCPNSEIAAAKIVNYTTEDSRRIEVVVAVSCDVPSVDVKSALLRCAEKHKDSNPTEKAPAAIITGYNEGTINYSLRIWVETDKYWDIYFELLQQVKDELDASGIKMTYPHMNVHIVEK